MASWNESCKFELNSTTPWTMGMESLPEKIPVWILAEETTCDPTKAPSVFRIVYNPDNPNNQMIEVLDRELDDEQFLSPNEWAFIAWRPLTDHAGTFDQYFAKAGVNDYSNWTLNLP